MKKQKYHLANLLISGVVMLIACNDQNRDANTGNETGASDKVQGAEAIVSSIFPDTTVNGSARFIQQSNGSIKLEVQLTIPAKANDQVAVHIHENADCGNNAEDAGDHWNPTSEMHGKWGSDQFHLGDIGNISLDENGKGSLTLETDKWTIGTNSQTDILNKAIIVHGGVDDYSSQPSGSAGTRIGCAVIRKANDQSVIAK